jgi:hypothetical protein
MECVYCQSLAPKLGVSNFKTLTGIMTLQPVCSQCTPRHAAGERTSVLGLTPADKVLTDVDRMTFVRYGGFVREAPVIIPMRFHQSRKSTGHLRIA